MEEGPNNMCCFHFMWLCPYSGIHCAHPISQTTTEKFIGARVLSAVVLALLGIAKMEIAGKIVLIPRPSPFSIDSLLGMLPMVLVGQLGMLLG